MCNHSHLNAVSIGAANICDVCKKIADACGMFRCQECALSICSMCKQLGQL